MKNFTFMFIGLLFLTGCNWMFELQLGGLPEGVSEGNTSVPYFEAVDQNNQAMTTEDFRGGYWIATLIFTECPTVCPMMTPNMISLQEFAIEEDLPVHFVAFTVDPENDSPERLGIYGTNMGVNFETGTFLTGYEQEEIEQFSLEAFTSPVVPLEDGSDIAHSTRFFLVDPNGDVIRLYNGLAIDQSNIQRDLMNIIN